jgi:hypothetical protein
MASSIRVNKRSASDKGDTCHQQLSGFAAHKNTGAKQALPVCSGIPYVCN